MHCKLCPDLTLHFMRIGCTLHDAERLATFLMTRVVVVVTLMECAICPPDEEDQEDRMVCTYSRTESCDTGMCACSTVGPGIVVESRVEPLLHF